MFSTILLFTTMLLSTVISINMSTTQKGRAQPPTCDQIITKWTLWASPSPGLAATLKVPVTQQISSWKVEFAFNKQFTKINFFKAASEEKEGSVFSVTNQSWSGKKVPGDVISFSMLGDYEQGNASEPIMITDISINGGLLCSNVNL